MEKPTFVYATFIRATPEKLWEALTNGEFSEKYWFGFRVQVELKAGGTIRILPPKGMEQKGDHAGKVLVCEPYRKLVYTWNPKDKPELAANKISMADNSLQKQQKQRAGPCLGKPARQVCAAVTNGSVGPIVQCAMLQLNSFL